MLNKSQKETTKLICDRLDVSVAEVKRLKNNHIFVVFHHPGVPRGLTATLSSTPSDWRTRMNTVSNVRRQMVGVR